MQERRRHYASFVRAKSRAMRRLEADAAHRQCEPRRRMRPARFGSFYLRALPTSENTVLTCVPTVWTATIMKTAISEAISAYSIAVAPDSSAAKFLMDLNIGVPAS